MNTKGKAFFVSEGDPPSKQAILRAALKLFVRDGFSATDIRAIGQEAGYSNTAMFKFFKTKETLAFFLFERCYLRYADGFALAMKSGNSFEEKLEAILDRFFVLVDEDTESFLFMQDHLREFWRQAAPELKKKSILAQAHRLVELGKVEKKIRGETDSKIMVAAFMGFLAQFAKMVYFGDFKGGAMAWKADIQRVIRKILLN